MNKAGYNHREAQVRRWFSMWLDGQDTGIGDLFAPDAVYIESWGPEYHGSEKIKLWFDEWNTRGTVQCWDIRQYFHKENQTVVEWSFRCAMTDGVIQSFDGLSLIRWNEVGQICFLQEFGCNENRYDPYAQGKTPVFREKHALWF
ncbi:nuclear transport factor 2 family protein [Candidatus Pseudoscillospira sp. SGI.172]|uniref:nuclear transport factor 2 family protein n=1 Tax=Candidatus Pseudoscillospira sp. SGI.172 TaxID=3420582 RepID=UPI002A7E78AA|nr:nuclear transport factor 2 family protein [Pseudoflavonifractor sp.]MDY3019377.1 nuclear transport factor 2 family protein [Oscillospiraceae bacterium]